MRACQKATRSRLARPLAVVLSNPRTIRNPSAWAMRESVPRLVRCRPLSIREICEWLVPTSSARFSWLSPRSMRYLMRSHAISRKPSRSASWARYAGLAAARRAEAPAAVLPTGLGAAAACERVPARDADFGLTATSLEDRVWGDIRPSLSFLIRAGNLWSAYGASWPAARGGRRGSRSIRSRNPSNRCLAMTMSICGSVPVRFSSAWRRTKRLPDLWYRIR